MTSTSFAIASSKVLFTNPSLYHNTVGSLHYVLLTRPDITFDVNYLSQFAQAPQQAHWLSLKRILRYLYDTINLGLSLQPTASISLTRNSNANWVPFPINRKSMG